MEWVRKVFDHKAKPWFRAEFIHPSEFSPAKAPAKPAVVRSVRTG